MGTLNIRLDTKTASLIARIAAQTGKRKSEIVREALRTYGERFPEKSTSARPYDKIKDLIGSLDSGGLQLSERTGEKFTEMLLKERDERRRADRRRATRRAAR
jgi:RHH-type transcriptional regulator, rel operon repressor / antitoxin RelB